MLFNSIDFLMFFPIVVLIYWLIPKKVRYLWLLFASYYFYMNWNYKYALLLVSSTLITYVAALLIMRNKGKRIAKLILIGGLVTNLGILFVFKYLGFFFVTLNRVLSVLHISSVSPPFSFLLPVGISFYIFQALSYMIDVYRGEVKAERNPLRYALFVSFFPQLVAGPIERAGNLLSQLQDIDYRKKPNYNTVASGLILMIWGLFMKMVIADRVAIFVDNVFDRVYALGTVETVAGAIGFSLQIYCDFAGYSAVAIGASEVMGFHLMENFNVPYFSCSIKEFWKRWHISLSSWFQSYVYIPLGGNKCSRWKRNRNLLITFLVSGIWHGANWTFLIWGCIHGVLLVVENSLQPLLAKVEKKLRIQTSPGSYKLGKIIVTFSITTFAWIFFRATSISNALVYIKRMCTVFNPWVLFNDTLLQFGLDPKEINILLVSTLILFIVDVIKYKRNETISSFLLRQNLWFRWIAIILLVITILVYGEYGINFDSKQFIYFDF